MAINILGFGNGKKWWKSAGDHSNTGYPGTNGDDSIAGGIGHGKLSGGKGKDTIDGGAGNEKLYGGNGRGTLQGGRGGDDLYGGEGADLFIYYSPTESD